MRNILIVSFWVTLLSVGGPAFSAPAKTSETADAVHQDLAKQLSSLNYLLSVDRLQYYGTSLADYLQDHGQPLIAEALRRVSPEDIHRQMFSMQDLNNPDKWHELLLETMRKNIAEARDFKVKDMEWNYRFFRNKLLEGFKVDSMTIKESDAKVQNPARAEFADQALTPIDAKTVLLDSERYIATKTTRGLFWDAAVTGKSVEFHIGTERDFRQTIQIEGRQVVAEVKTRERNYNKIYLVFDAKTNAYSYAFTRISGQDRVTHLMLQLRLLRFEQKFPMMKGTARVYGSAEKFHAEQEATLTKLFKTLPKADQVVIGQKGAIENLIASAGMMAKIQPDVNQSSQSGDTAFKKLANKVATEGSYFSVAGNGSAVKTVFEAMPNPEALEYETVRIEQPSHDIADVILETKEGDIVRWRLISNMWGDEAVPVARALKNSGHTEIVYIGTAGALHDKGYKVGDVVAPRQTYTQDGRLLSLAQPTYGANFVKTSSALGQVRSPFDETKAWMTKWESKIDLVELETGYIRDALGANVNFQPYLLVSDIVGSENETLAEAAQDSGKRKNGQMRLLESVFLKNSIKQPVTRFEAIEMDKAFNEMFRRIDVLRASRDLTSKMQLTQLALRQGLKTDVELEALIKSQPAFDQRLLFDRLQSASDVLRLFMERNKDFRGALAGSEELLNGTWNAKQALNLEVMPSQPADQVSMKRWEKELAELSRRAGSFLSVKVAPYSAANMAHSLALDANRADFLNHYYEDVILKPKGLVREYDKTGGIRYRPVDEFSRGLRCEAVYL